MRKYLLISMALMLAGIGAPFVTYSSTPSNTSEFEPRKPATQSVPDSMFVSAPFPTGGAMLSVTVVPLPSSKAQCRIGLAEAAGAKSANTAAVSKAAFLTTVSLDVRREFVPPDRSPSGTSPQSSVRAGHRQGLNVNNI